MMRARRLMAVMAATALAVAAASTGIARAAAGDDPEARSQWALAQVGAPQAWARTTGAGVRIGIVDTGVDLAHEDLAGKIVASTNCLGAVGTPARCSGSGQDDNGHGTHVAGIAAAVRGNGVGIAGIAPDAQLVVAKAVPASGPATVADVVAGIKWVVDHGAQVVNLSLEWPGLTFVGVRAAAIQEGLDYAWSRGAVPVLAAGSPRRLGTGLGSRSDRDLNAVVVGATTAAGHMAATSPPTGSARLAVLAPGGSGGTDPATDVLSTFWAAGRHDAYEARGGTSSAAAYASGALALLMAEGYNALGAVERLLSTADGTVTCGEGSPDCYGRIDVAAATAGPVEQSSR
jgi:subtilisin family serine protease